MANQVNIKFDGDSQKLVQATSRIAESMDAVVGRMEKMERSGQKAGKEIVVGFGAVELASKALSGTLDLIKASFDAIAEKREKAFGTLAGAEFNLGQLAQVSKTKKEYEALLEIAKQLASTSGIGLDQAGKQVFDLKSAGALDQLPLLASLKQNSAFNDPFQFGAKTQKIINALGEEETGGFRNVANKVVAAAAQSEVTAEEFAPLVTATAGSAAQFGLSDELLLSALSAGTTAEEPALAQTKINQFLLQSEKGRAQGDLEFAKGDLFGAIAEVRKQLDSGANLFEIMPEQRAQAGFVLLEKQLGEIKRINAEVERAQALTGKGDAIDTMLGFSKGTIVEAIGKARTLRVQADIAEATELGPAKASAEQVIAATRTASSQSGENIVSRFAREQALNALSVFAPESVASSRLAADQQGGLTSVSDVALDTILDGLVRVLSLRAGLISQATEGDNRETLFRGAATQPALPQSQTLSEMLVELRALNQKLTPAVP